MTALFWKWYLIISLITSSQLLAQNTVLQQKDSIQQEKKDISGQRSTKPSSPDEILLTYRKQLLEEAKLHRQYIQAYYDKIYYTAVSALVVLGGVLVFFGFRYEKDIKLSVKELYLKYSKSVIEKFIDEKFEPMSTKLDQHKEDLDKNISDRQTFEKTINKHAIAQDFINVRQEGILYQMQADLGLKEPIRARYKVNNTFVSLEYLTDDGSEVQISKEQELEGISGRPNYVSSDDFTADVDGKIGKVSTSEGGSSEVDGPILRIDYRCEPPLTTGIVFKKNMSATIKNSFTNTAEWFEFRQFYISSDEKFELKTPMSRELDRVWLEQVLSKVDGKEQIEELDKDTYIDQPRRNDNLVIHTINIPCKNYPATFKIKWTFK